MYNDYPARHFPKIRQYKCKFGIIFQCKRTRNKYLLW